MIDLGVNGLPPGAEHAHCQSDLLRVYELHVSRLCCQEGRLVTGLWQPRVILYDCRVSVLQANNLIEFRKCLTRADHLAKQFSHLLDVLDRCYEIISVYRQSYGTLHK